MMMRYLGAAVLSLAGVFAAVSFAAAQEKDPYDELEDLRKQHQEELKQSREKYKQEAQQKVDEQARQFKAEQDEHAKLKADSVMVDDKDIGYTEPGDVAEAIGKSKGSAVSVWELSPDDYDILDHEIWKLRKEDFRHSKPVEVNVEFEDLPDQTYFVVPFTVTNSDAKPRRIAPRLWIMCSGMRYTPEVGGFIVRSMVEKSTLTDFESVADLAGYIKGEGASLERVGFFEAGETRKGLAIFKRFDQQATEMKIIVDGLDNDMKYDRALRRALVLNFTKRGDEFYPQRESLIFKGQDFEYIWNWYQEMEVVERPAKKAIDAPLGKRSKSLWYYRVSLRNRTGEKRDLTLARFDTVVPVEVSIDVTRKDRAGKSTTKSFKGVVEAALVDDGESTIHKAQVMRETGVEFQADRLFKGSLEDGKSAECLVIFDEADVDFAPIFAHIEDRLNSEGFESTLENPQKIEDLYVRVHPPVIDLTDEEKDEIRKQVLQGVPAALEDCTAKKLLTADVAAKNQDLSAGTYRVRRSYVQRGVIDESWINKWENY